MLGFIKIIRNNKVFVKLQLPKSVKKHQVFNANLLEKDLKEKFTNQVNKPLSLIITTAKKVGSKRYL